MAKRMKRIVIGVVLAVVVLLLAGGLIFYLNLNRVVKRTVEQQATASLNLNTQVDSANLALFGGHLNLDDLRIASPSGFSAEPMLVLGGTDVTVTYGQLRGNPIRINKIVLNKPKLLLEHSGGALNIKKMMDQLPASDPNAKPMKMIIDELAVQDPVVVLRGMPLLDKELTVPVASFSLKNIGTGEGAQNGVAVKDVVSQLVTALAANASNSDALPPELRNLLKGDVTAIVGMLGGEARKRLTDALPGPMGQVVSGLLDPNMVKDPGKAFGSLLGGNGKRGTTNPAATTQPAQPAADPAKIGGDALQGILGGKKKE